MMAKPYVGHVNPLLPIAGALVGAGHDVVWITGRQFQPRVEAVGARFHALPQEMDPEGCEAYDFYPELAELRGVAQVRWYIKHVFLDECAYEVEALESVLAGFPADVLVGDSVTFGVYFYAEKVGLPCASLSVLPGAQASRDTAPYGLGLLPGAGPLGRLRNRVLNFLLYDVLLRDVTTHANEVRARFGLQPLSSNLFVGLAEKVDMVICLTTPAFEYPRSDEPAHFHYVGPSIPRTEAEFREPPWWSDLEGDEKVVLVSQGTVATDPKDLLLPAIRGLADRDYLVVAVPLGEGGSYDLPGNVLAADFIPFDRLLPKVDVLVTNAGYGTTQWALSHGIPLVAAGDSEDKMEVAARVRWSGAGIDLRKKRVTPEEVDQAVLKLLEEPSYRRNARRIQEDFAGYHAPSRVVELIEELTQR